MSEIKLAAALPKGEANGLGPIVPSLVDDPTRPRVVLMILDCKEITTNADTGEIVPTARIRRVEALLDGDLDAAQRLMERALEVRPAASRCRWAWRTNSGPRSRPALCTAPHSHLKRRDWAPRHGRRLLAAGQAAALLSNLMTGL